MAMVKLLIQVPMSIKAKLDAIRATGTSASGLIRHLLQEHFNQAAQRGPKGR